MLTTAVVMLLRLLFMKKTMHIIIKHFI